jgi:8-oxo-dGTP pyrophosphatase MutT (NUDIX family)
MNTDYVLGFAFDEARENVALILKRRPTWQAGFYNGVGGKVEPSEEGYPRMAMSRKFLEETGVAVPEKDWQLVARLMGTEFMVYVFAAFTDLALEASTQTDERIDIIPVSELDSHKEYLISNASWLMAMCLDRDMPRFAPVTVVYS